MAKANYINHDGSIAVLEIVKDNKDGTVDLASAPKQDAIVTRCPVLVAPQPGCCMILNERKSKDADAKAQAQADAEAAAAKQAAEDAAAAAAANA